jgi:hypothetical protein
MDHPEEAEQQAARTELIPINLVALPAAILVCDLGLGLISHRLAPLAAARRLYFPLRGLCGGDGHPLRLEETHVLVAPELRVGVLCDWELGVFGHAAVGASLEECAIEARGGAPLAEVQVGLQVVQDPNKAHLAAVDTVV